VPDELSPDPALASFRAAALAPLGPADTHRLLAAPSAAARLRLLDELLDDADAVLRFHLGTADPADGAAG
jgi:hypothetical protein